jgi:hypothetical protein
MFYKSFFPLCENERLKEQARRHDEARARRAKVLEKYKDKWAKAKHIFKGETSFNGQFQHDMSHSTRR